MDRRTIVIPEDVLETVNNHPGAKTAFDNFSASHKNEYLAWINEAKTNITRSKRIATMIDWLHDGKRMNCKYEHKQSL